MVIMFSYTSTLNDDDDDDDDDDADDADDAADDYDDDDDDDDDDDVGTEARVSFLVLFQFPLQYKSSEQCQQWGAPQMPGTMFLYVFGRQRLEEIHMIFIWRFPEIGVPPNHPFLCTFPCKPSILDTSIYGNPSYDRGEGL